MAPVGVQLGGEDPRRVARLEDDGARPIAEQDAGPRSLKSRMREKTSAPITRALRAEPVRKHGIGDGQRVGESEHTARTSNAAQPWMPSLFCTMHAVDGNTMSGVEVATTMRSMSCGRHCQSRALPPRRAHAQIAARRARIGEVAGTDAGALDDPLVGGLDALGREFARKFGIGHAPRRQVATGAGDAG